MPIQTNTVPFILSIGLIFCAKKMIHGMIK